MSSRLSRAAGVSAIFTLFGACFYFGIGTFLTIAQGGNPVQFFFECLIGTFVCWVALTLFLEPIMGRFDEINKPRPRNDGTTGDPGEGDNHTPPSPE